MRQLLRASGNALFQLVVDPAHELLGALLFFDAADGDLEQEPAVNRVGPRQNLQARPEGLVTARMQTQLQRLRFAWLDQLAAQSME